MLDTSRPYTSHELELRLTPRDQRVVQHVHRNRMTVLQVLRRDVLHQLSYNGAAKLVSRLCQRAILAKYPLGQAAKYFVLGEVGARLLGLADYRALPLGPQALPAEYATLSHVTLGKVARTRLTTNEIVSRYPWLPKSLAAAPHCLEERHQILELVRVDLGGTADHVARKCAAEIVRRQELPEFTSFVASGRFRLVVVTATQEKSVAIRQALNCREWPQGLLIHLVVLPKLLSLLAHRRHA